MIRHDASYASYAQLWDQSKTGSRTEPDMSQHGINLYMRLESYDIPKTCVEAMAPGKLWYTKDLCRGHGPWKAMIYQSPVSRLWPLECYDIPKPCVEAMASGMLWYTKALCRGYGLWNAMIYQSPVSRLWPLECYDIPKPCVQAVASGMLWYTKVS